MKALDALPPWRDFRDYSLREHPAAPDMWCAVVYTTDDRPNEWCWSVWTKQVYGGTVYARGNVASKEAAQLKADKALVEAFELDLPDLAEVLNQLRAALSRL